MLGYFGCFYCFAHNIEHRNIYGVIVITINLRRDKRRVIWLFKEHFELLFFIFLFFILGLGYFYIDSNIYLSAVCAVILVVNAILYYYIYFKKYQVLTDTVSQYHYYYYDIYSVWGIIFFNAIFLFVFAYIGTVLSVIFPSLGFGQIEINDLVLFLIQTVIDSLFLGVLGAYSINWSTINMQGLFAKTFIYVANVTIDLAFISSLVAVITESIKTKRELKNVFVSKKINKEYFSSLTPAKIKAIMKYCAKGDDIIQYESELVSMLKESRSKDVKDLMLQIFQSTKNINTLSACHDYFDNNKDHRFDKVCRKTKNPHIKQFLKNNVNSNRGKKLN